MTADFPWQNLVSTQTRLFNKSRPAWRLLFNDEFWNFSEASKTSLTQPGLLTFKTPWCGK